MNPLRLALAVAITVAGVAAPRDARAQASSPSPYSTSVYNEGPGLRLGSAPLVLNAGIAAEIGYDSNVFYQAANEVGAGLMRLRAHVDVSTISSRPVAGDLSTANPVFDLRFTAQAEYREYLLQTSGFQTSGPSIRSPDPAVREQRSINLLAGADVALMPRGPYTLRLVDTFLRTIDPRNYESPNNFTRDFNRVGLIGSYHAGALEYGLSDYFNVNYFESADVAFGNSYSDEGEAFARFKLLSQTLVSLTARAGYVRYTNDTALDSVPFRILAGASTLFTTWLGASAAIGYGNSFSRNGPSFNSAIGSAEVRFLFPHAARISVGYRRDFFDSLIANAYSDDQVYVAFDQPFTPRFSAHVDGSVRFRNYIGLVNPTSIKLDPGAFSSTSRDDKVYDVHAELSVRIADWLAASLSYNLQADRTDFAVSGTPVNYVKHSAFLRFDFAY